MSDFGFVGGSYIAASLTQNDQESINWYPETDPTKTDDNPTTQDLRGVIALYPAPGLLLKLETAAGGPVRATYTLPGSVTCLVVSSNVLYYIDANFNETAVGTLLTTSGPVSIADNGVSAYLCDGASRYYYTWGTNTFAAINDGAFANGTRTDIIDNFLIYNNPGTNQWGCTDALSVTSSALNFSSADGSTGNLISLIVSNREIFLIKECFTEVWTDVGTFPFPFQRIPGTSMQHGTLAPFSVSRLGESFAFLANDTRGNATVVQMKGYTPVRISTFAVEYAIQNYAVTNDAVAYTYTQSGHEFYVLNFPTEDITWVYDLATGYWHKRAYRDANNILHRHRGNCSMNFNGDVIVGDWQNGNLYMLSQSTFTDMDGSLIPCIRRCQHLTTDLKRQFFHDLQIQFQPGVGLQTGQGSDPKAVLTWSDDGGSTFGTQHTATIGKTGQYKHRAIWRRLGAARDRIFEVTVTDPVYRVVVSANLNATPGSN